MCPEIRRWNLPADPGNWTPDPPKDHPRQCALCLSHLNHRGRSSMTVLLWKYCHSQITHAVSAGTKHLSYLCIEGWQNNWARRLHVNLLHMFQRWHLGITTNNNKLVLHDISGEPVPDLLKKSIDQSITDCHNCQLITQNGSSFNWILGLRLVMWCMVASSSRNEYY